MANKKDNKPKVGPLGTPLGNPLGYFKKEASKRLAAYRKGGYNVPKNDLPKRYNGGSDEPIPPSQGGNSGMIRNPYEVKKPNVSSVRMENPFVTGTGLSNALNYKPTSVARPSVTTPVTTTSSSTAPTSTSVNTTPTKELSFKEKKKALKEQAKLDKLQRKIDLKKVKDENLKKQYESGEKRVETAADKIDRALRVGETVIGGVNAVNQLRRPAGGNNFGPSGFKKGGSAKSKTTLMKKKIGGSLMSKKKK